MWPRKANNVDKWQVASGSCSVQHDGFWHGESRKLEKKNYRKAAKQVSKHFDIWTEGREQCKFNKRMLETHNNNSKWLLFSVTHLRYMKRESGDGGSSLNKSLIWIHELMFFLCNRLQGYYYISPIIKDTIFYQWKRFFFGIRLQLNYQQTTYLIYRDFFTVIKRLSLELWLIWWTKSGSERQIQGKSVSHVLIFHEQV